MRKGSLWVVWPLLVLSWMVTGCEDPQPIKATENSSFTFEKVADLNLTNNAPLLDVIVKDNYIYAISPDFFGSKLHVVDVSDPKAPIEVKRIDAVFPNRLDIKDDHLYMVDRMPYQLKIYDISDQANPALESNLTLEYNLSKILYAKYSGGFTFDESDLYPQDNNVSRTYNSNIQVFAKDNNYTYVWYDGVTFQIDTNDTSNPSVHQSIYDYLVITPDSIQQSFSSIYVKNDTRYAAGVLRVLKHDMKDNNYTLTANERYNPYANINSVVVNNHYYGIWAKYENIIGLPIGKNSSEYRIASKRDMLTLEHNGSYLFASHSSTSLQGIEVFNISNPDKPKKSHSFATSSAVLSMSIKDTYLYTGSRSGMLTIYKAVPVPATTNTTQSTEGTSDIDQQFLADFIGVDVNSPIFTTPTAVVVAEKNVTVGTTVTLDGTQSEDPNGDALTFAWTLASKPDASTAVLSSTDANITSFTADENGTYLVSLVVKNDGNFTAERNVTITAYAPVDDTPPVIEEDPTVTDNNVTAMRVGSIQTATIAEEIPGFEVTYNYRSIAYSIALGTNHVFVGALDGLSAVNLSPVELNSTYTAMGTAEAVAINGNYAYVTDNVEGASFHLYTLNISNPAAITMESNQTLGSLTTDLVVSGDYLYAATGDGLEIFNIRDTNATAPVSEGNYSVFWANTVAATTNIVYVGTSSSGIHEVNVSNPSNPTLIRSYEANATSFSGVMDIALSNDGSHAYLANDDGGWDIVATDTLTQVAHLDANLSVNAIVIEGNYTFVSDTGAGILIYDVSTPATPLLVGTIVMGDNSASDMVVRDGFLYTAENNGSMGVYELTYPSTQTPDATPTYTVSTLAGTYNYPKGAVVDSAGNLFVVNTGNWTISKITPEGTASVFAGSGTQASVDGVGTEARFDTINYIAKDSSDNLYVTQANTFAIRKITPEGNVTTFKTLTKLPTGIAIDSSGTLYVVLTDMMFNTVEIIKIPSDGNSETVWVGGAWGYADGVGTAAKFSGTAGLAMDGSDTLYVADAVNHRIRKITPDGNVTTLAGLTSFGATDGNSSVATFTYPEDVTVDSAGNVYVADRGNHKIRKITPDGMVSTIAGSGTAGSADGVGIEATFNTPRGIAIDSSGTLYLSDTSNNKIRKIVP